jgi:nicotinamide-nucleotide amidase
VHRRPGGRAVTAVAGSSDYFAGGVVAYSNRLKTRLVGVPEDLLAAHGAVSEPVAIALAEGARRALGGDYGIGVTGIAGPAGGSEAKPVGTVHLAVAGPDGLPSHRRVRFPGDRERVRWQASQLALDMLRRRLLGDLAAAEAAREASVPERATPAAAR